MLSFLNTGLSNPALHISPQWWLSSLGPDLQTKGKSIRKSRDIKQKPPTQPPNLWENSCTFQVQQPAFRAAGFTQFSASLVQESDSTGVTRTISYSEAQKHTFVPSNSISYRLQQRGLANLSWPIKQWVHTTLKSWLHAEAQRDTPEAVFQPLRRHLTNYIDNWIYL